MMNQSQPHTHKYYKQHLQLSQSQPHTHKYYKQHLQLHNQYNRHIKRDQGIALTTSMLNAKP